MAKFKVGDRVRVITPNVSEFAAGSIGEVTIIDAKSAVPIGVTIAGLRQWFMLHQIEPAPVPFPCAAPSPLPETLPAGTVAVNERGDRYTLKTVGSLRPSVIASEPNGIYWGVWAGSCVTGETWSTPRWIDWESYHRALAAQSSHAAEQERPNWTPAVGEMCEGEGERSGDTYRGTVAALDHASALLEIRGNGVQFNARVRRDSLRPAAEGNKEPELFGIDRAGGKTGIADPVQRLRGKRVTQRDIEEGISHIAAKMIRDGKLSSDDPVKVSSDDGSDTIHICPRCGQDFGSRLNGRCDYCGTTEMQLRQLRSERSLDPCVHCGAPRSGMTGTNECTDCFTTVGTGRYDQTPLDRRIASAHSALDRSPRGVRQVWEAWSTAGWDGES